MQSSKKLGIKLLPTLLVLMSMLLVACGGSTSTTTTVPSQKAPASQQVLNMPFFNGVSDIKTFDPALIDGHKFSRCYRPRFYWPGSV